MARAYGDIDPKLRELSFVTQDRKALWSHCRRQFIEFWSQHDSPNRHIPRGYRDGEHGTPGWWFPTKWVRNFQYTPVAKDEEIEIIPDDSPEEAARRAVKAETATASIETNNKPKNETPWFDKPMVEEDAAKPSPELLATLKRKWHIMGGKVPN